MMDTNDNNALPSHKRRVRYKGSHPRHFAQKYKEHDPERYAGTVEKVIQSGKTPAGTHRPVLVQEILQVLNPQPGQMALDATLGYGGHALEILQRILPGGCLWGLDVDPVESKRAETRLRARGYSDQEFRVKRMNFAGMPKIVHEVGGGFDLILADLGVSSMQLDDPARGFTFKREGPLDLRLNPERGQTAAALLQSLTEKEFAHLLIENADEPQARGIAKAVFKSKDPIGTTAALAEAVRRALPRSRGDADEDERTRAIRRTFQALRIAVNDEFVVLDKFLKCLPACLKPQGRVALVTFHPGEERRVVHSLQEGLVAGWYSQISPEPIRPSSQEQYDNARSKSARLHWAQRRLD